MSSHNEQIEPTGFDTPDNSIPGSLSASSGSRTNGTPAWVLPMLMVLLVAVIGVVFWLPGRFNQQPIVTSSSAEPVSSTSVATTDRRQVAEVETSPWSDAQMAKLRKQAQDVLTELLEAQSTLEQLEVVQWAAEDFADAGAHAAAGDIDYRERRFEAARVNYEKGLDELRTLLEMFPQVLRDNLARAHQAIDAGQKETAQAALLIATAIEADNAELASLKQRAAVMEQLLSLLAQAEEATASSELALAVQLLQQAVALDPQSHAAQSELEVVSKAYTRQRFNKAMSDGYLALNMTQFDRARSAFKQAAQLVTNSAVAASALDDVNTAETTQRLSDLQAKGQGHVSQEQWAKAVSVFEQALQIDAGLMFAQQGLKSSQVRNHLGQQLQSAIEQPERLSEKGVAEAIAKLLRSAAEISPRGPLLQQRITQLELVLRRANTPIHVSLRSDMETEVSLRKVTHLGRFQEHELSLRPGTYTAVGSRDGYRDVRVTFTIQHDTETATVTITCTEQI